MPPLFVKKLTPTLALLGALLQLSGCASGDKATTTGKRVVLRTQVRADAAFDQEFRSGTKWTIQLKTAAIAVDAFYYFDGPPAVARFSAPRRSPLETLQRLFVGVAHAHPQHYDAGTALGEMVTPTSVDLFDGTKNLEDGVGVTGAYRSGRLVFSERNSGALAEALDGHAAIAGGVATKGDTTVYFNVSADFADIARSAPEGKIDGCRFDEVVVGGDGTVTLTVMSSVWFNLVDFSQIDPGSIAEPTLIPSGSVAHTAFALGVAQLSAYTFSYSF